MIYFIQAGPRGPIKIGHTRRDIELRLADLQTGNGMALTLLGSIPGGPSLERELHKRFASDLSHGEWFSASAELVAYLAGHSICTLDGRVDGVRPQPGRTGFELGLIVPPSVLEELVDLATEHVLERLAARADDGVWLDVDGAARHLGCPRSRIYDLCRDAGESGFPVHKDGRRSYFRGDELDAWRRDRRRGRD
jgi:hypothetical protein